MLMMHPDSFNNPDSAIELLEELDYEIKNYLNGLVEIKKTIFYMVKNNLHIIEGLSRYDYFAQIFSRAGVNKKFFIDLVNSSLVASHINVYCDALPADVFFYLKIRADKSDWEHFYISNQHYRENQLKTYKKDVNIRKDKSTIMPPRHIKKHIKLLENYSSSVNCMSKTLKSYYGKHRAVNKRKMPEKIYLYWNDQNIGQNNTDEIIEKVNLEQVINDIEKLATQLNQIRRDVYYFVHTKIHLNTDLSRYGFFKKIRTYLISENRFILDLVNSAIVESVAKIPNGTLPLEVLVALSDAANLDDWKAIYDLDKTLRESKFIKLKTKHGIPIITELNSNSTITSITTAIEKYYEDNKELFKPRKVSKDKINYRYIDFDYNHTPIVWDDEESFFNNNDDDDEVINLNY